jgi:hypothetical protein
MTCAEAVAISPVFHASRLHIKKGFINKVRARLEFTVLPSEKVKRQLPA